MGKIFDKLRIQGRMQIFEKMSQSALNHVLILQKDRTQKMLQIPLKIIDLQNDFNIAFIFLYYIYFWTYYNILVAKQ